MHESWGFKELQRTWETVITTQSEESLSVFERSQNEYYASLKPTYTLSMSEQKVCSKSILSTKREVLTISYRFYLQIFAKGMSNTEPTTIV